MPKIELSITINAPVDHVYAVARDVESFPSFMADLKSLTVVERSEDGLRTVTDWTGLIREFKMEVKWTQEDIWNPEIHRDDFRMLKGDMNSMSGFWLFTAEGSGTRFDSVMEYEYDVPLIGPMIKALIKKKMTDNLQATLEAIKSRAESA
jgi:uncharacterized membrane protein